MPNLGSSWAALVSADPQGLRHPPVSVHQELTEREKLLLAGRVNAGQARASLGNFCRAAETSTSEAYGSGRSEWMDVLHGDGKGALVAGRFLQEWTGLERMGAGFYSLAPGFRDQQAGSYFSAGALAMSWWCEANTSASRASRAYSPAK